MPTPARVTQVTPFTVNMLVIDRYFCIAKAKHLLGYAPIRHFDEVRVLIGMDSDGVDLSL